MKTVLKTMAVVLGLYLIGFVVFAANLPAAPESVGKPDAIVALTGGGTRLDAAVGLFERGTGKRLLISGVAPQTTKKELKIILHGGKRFDCCADLGFQAANTHGNAEEAARWVRAHGFKSIVLVTATYHMPRARQEFAARMPGVRIAPYPVEPEGIDLHEWWRDPRALRVLSGEYTKYLGSVVLTHVFGQGTLDPAPQGGKAPRVS